MHRWRCEVGWFDALHECKRYSDGHGSVLMISVYPTALITPNHQYLLRSSFLPSPSRARQVTICSSGVAAKSRTLMIAYHNRVQSPANKV